MAQDDLQIDPFVAPPAAATAAAADAEGSTPRGSRDLEAVYDIPVVVSAVLGRVSMPINQLLKLGRGPEGGGRDFLPKAQ